MPLVNLGFIESQTKSKSPQNSTFNIFTSNLRFSEIFGNCDQVDSQQAPKTLILIRSSERVETNVLAKIIKYLVQQLFMDQNWS